MSKTNSFHNNIESKLKEFSPIDLYASEIVKDLKNLQLKAEIIDKKENKSIEKDKFDFIETKSIF